MLRVALLNRQRQPVHFFAHLDAKRAGFEVVQRQAAAGLVDLGLAGGRALHWFFAAKHFKRQHERAQCHTQRSEKEADHGFHQGNQRLEGVSWQVSAELAHSSNVNP